ncbi:transposase [Coleofasciculus sp. E1-EBD-02]|uniref:transposase n=1 Tax=Coleofasciculus sp. E1-EBD-02 TaxID=3068481 RepID=UPI0032F12356
MHPPLWHPPIELSASEQVIVSRIRRAKLFIFLRQIRHRLFDEQFQRELAQIYTDSPKGHPPVPPAQLALVVILQAYTGASDDEAIESLLMDKRWQLVMDCLDCEKAPFGKGTLVRLRGALIKRRLDRRLIERTVELARETQGFGHRNLRAALDSSPLWGAGKVEDTYNLLGHALRKALGVIACQQGRELAVVASEAGVSILQASSLKAALDINWDHPQQRQIALEQVLKALESVESWLAQLPQDDMNQTVNQTLGIARQIEAQNVEVDSDGSPVLRRGVAKDRRISIEDPTMRHGRKSSAVKFNGYKRHVLTDLDSGLVRAVGLTPANVPEAWVSDAISADLRAQQVKLVELHIDRAYLSAKLVRQREELRRRQLTSLGRAKNRERTAVEHSLAHLGRWQGNRARYIGLRKNLFDWRRAAVVHNLHVLARHFERRFTPTSLMTPNPGNTTTNQYPSQQ